MNEKELVIAFRAQYEMVDTIEKRLEEAKKALEETKQKLLDLFEANGSERTGSYEGVGFITRTKPRLYASCNAENQESLFKLLNEMGRADLIKPTIHTSTLSTFVGECIENGQPVPPMVSYVLKPSVRLYVK